MFYREIFYRHFIITLFLLSLIAPRVLLQDSPQERCNQGLGVDGFVCNDCLNIYDCTTQMISPCNLAELCDKTFFEQCAIVSIDFAPTCYCTEVGCVEDPTNPDVVDMCDVVNELPIATAGPCTTVGETIDFETCTCSLQTCPDCGLRAINPSETCSIDYQYCADGIFLPLQCLPGLCFNDELCSCQDMITSCCPECGFISDSNGDDGSFCFCENKPSICGLQCTEDYVYDTELCECVVR